MNKTIKRAVIRNHKCHEYWQDTDGHWILLERGYRCAYSGTHTIHEWTVKDAIKAIRGIERCDCEVCSAPYGF